MEDGAGLWQYPWCSDSDFELLKRLPPEQRRAFEALLHQQAREDRSHRSLVVLAEDIGVSVEARLNEYLGRFAAGVGGGRRPRAVFE